MLIPVSPLLVFLSLLWTAWDPTYSSFRKAQIQGRDVRLQGKKEYIASVTYIWIANASHLLGSLGSSNDFLVDTTCRVFTPCHMPTFSKSRLSTFLSTAFISAKVIFWTILIIGNHCMYGLDFSALTRLNRRHTDINSIVHRSPDPNAPCYSSDRHR